MRKLSMLVIVLMLTTGMFTVLGCGGGGGGGSTTTFNGVVFEASGGENPDPVEDATVELWRDGLVMVDTDQTDIDGIFTLIGSDIVGVDIFFKVYKDPDNVPLNTELHTVPNVSVLADTIELPLISDSLALQLGSAVWGVNEPSWNSTMQEYAYVVFEVNESGVEDTVPADVTVLETGAAGAILNSSNIYYNNGSDTFATTNMTAQSNSNTESPAAAARVLAADANIMYSFASSNHPDGDINVGTVDAYLIPGEITMVGLEVDN